MENKQLSFFDTEDKYERLTKFVVRRALCGVALGLGFGDKVLDSRTLWDFENTLAESETMDELFCMFDEMLESE